jgi:16S rRNA G1207 methylase RsmC
MKPTAPVTSTSSTVTNSIRAAPDGLLDSLLVIGEVARWHIGQPTVPLGGTDALVALTAAELLVPSSRGLTAVGFHEAMARPALPAAGQVEIWLPGYRGRSFIPVLAWLAATRLASPAATISWHMSKRQGPDSVQRLLDELGWNLTRSRAGQDIVLAGPVPAAPMLPEPRCFDAQVGGQQLRFAADYGVFSPGGLDAGTELLLDVALRATPGEALADIGIGYGPLAIGLVRNGIGQRAVATDVDCIALWLARRNAAALNVSLAVECSPDPAAVPAAALTVCNVPTHINAEQSAALMAGLLARARHGRLLAVVHRSLEARYARYFAAARVPVRRHPGPDHVVLDGA